jgi:hypothetical protein
MTEYNHQNDWFYEGQVSKKLVDYFIKNGYKILKDNSDKISKRGEDIIVSIQGQQVIIEVKGYPTTIHTKGKDKGKPKVTSPKLQAKHWFSEALLSSIFNYQKQKVKGNIKLALAFPLFERYEELICKVQDFFTDNNISLIIYFVDEYGNITIDNLNRNERNKKGLITTNEN